MGLLGKPTILGNPHIFLSKDISIAGKDKSTSSYKEDAGHEAHRDALSVIQHWKQWWEFKSRWWWYLWFDLSMYIHV